MTQLILNIMMVLSLGVVLRSDRRISFWTRIRLIVLKSVIFLNLISTLAFAKTKVSGKPNFLLMFADDLGPVIDPYVSKDHPMFGKTPNINRIAETGQSFLFTTSQQSVCGPSRHSFLSGRFPDKTKLFNNEGLMSDVSSDMQSIPKYFREEQGYYTAAFGKVFHPQFDDNGNDIYYIQGHLSQPTEAYSANGNNECPATQGRNQMYCDTREEQGKHFLSDSIIAASVVDFLKQRRREALVLGDTSEKRKKESSGNWLALVGFRRPHLNNALPRSFFKNISVSSVEKYNFMKPTPKIEGPGNFRDKLAYYECRRINFKKSGNIKGEPSGKQIKQVEKFHKRDDEVARIRRSYFAAATFLDKQVGVILDSLEENNFSKNTVIMFFSDHGYQMGERNIWCKSTLYNTAAAVPLIVSVPGLLQNRISRSPTQLIDIFPTMIGLVGSDDRKFKDGSGLPLDGVSFLPSILNESEFHHAAMYSQYPRCVCGIQFSEGKSSSQCPSSSDYRDSELVKKPKTVQFHSCVAALSQAKPNFDIDGCSRPAIVYMGYSIRTQHWKYIEWREFHEEQLGCKKFQMGQEYMTIQGKEGHVGIDRTNTYTDWKTDPIERELYDVSGTIYQDQADDEVSNLAFNPTKEALRVMDDLSRMIKLQYTSKISKKVCNSRGILVRKGKSPNARCECVGNWDPKTGCRKLMKEDRKRKVHKLKDWTKYLKSLK